MDGFQKIDLDTKPLKEDSKITSVKSIKIFSKLNKKILLITLAVVGVVILVSLFAIVLPIQNTYQSVRKLNTQSKITLDAIKKQNIALAGSELNKTRTNLKEVQSNLNSLSWMKIVPIASGYYNDADHLIKAGFHGLDAGSILIESVKPYADVLGLKGQGSFTLGSAEQRIQTAVLTMGKITPKIDDIAKSLKAAQEDIDSVDPFHYPGFIGGDKIQKQLIQVRRLVDEGVTFVDQARPLIKVLPSLLGESKEKKYLVLFQNDKELRATGGFITAYAIFRVEKGIIHVDRSEDIYALDNQVPQKPDAPSPILKYLPKVSTLNLRDSNLSPDFVESMKTFNSLYNTIPGVTKVDGIIALDTHVLVNTIKILDDNVEAGGLTFNTKDNKRCDCPQVIYVLEDNISRPVNYVKTGRKDLLGALLYSTMQKALKSSPKQYWGPLFQDMFKEIAEKHILFYLYDSDAQAGMESLNASGLIKSFNGDYLHINDVNFAGAKSNMYVKQDVLEEYKIDSDGTITKTITLTYKNNHPPSDCDLLTGGLCLNATLRDWLRFYVPKGSTMVGDVVGSEVKMTTSEELGKTVFEGFLTVRPLGQSTFKISYKLPFKLSKDSVLPVLIQKQPGTDNNSYTIKVNGVQKEKFELLGDKQFDLRF